MKKHRKLRRKVYKPYEVIHDNPKNPRGKDCFSKRLKTKKEAIKFASQVPYYEVRKGRKTILN